jgi:preprotein translocase SecE subunit
MTWDNQRLLQYALYGLALVAWFVVWKFFTSVSDLILLLRHMPQVEVPVLGSLNNLLALVALAVSSGAAEYARRNPVSNKFGVEVLTELRKVSWPNWIDVRGTTLVVLGVTMVVSAVLWFFDTIYDFLVQQLFKLAGA